MRPSRSQLIVAGSVMVDLLGYGLIMPLLPYLPALRGSVQPWLIGALAALYALLQAIAAPLLGRLSDRIGRRPVLLLCLSGSTLAYLLFSLAQQPWQLAAALALAGAAGSSLPTAQAFVSDTTPSAQRSAALGLLGAAFGLGIIGGALLGGLLSRIAIGLPPATAAAIAAGNTLIAWRLLPESLPPQARTAAAQPAAVIWRDLLPGRVRLLLPALFAVNLGFAGLQSIAALATLQRFGWTPLDNGLLFAAAAASAAVTQAVLLGRLQPHLGDRGLLALGLFLFGSALIPLGLAIPAAAVVPLVALIAAGMGLSIAPLTALLSAETPPERRGALLGLLQALVSLALTLGPLSAAALFSSFGPGVPFSLAGALTLFTLILAAPALRRPPHGTIRPAKEDV